MYLISYTFVIAALGDSLQTSSDFFNAKKVTNLPAGRQETPCRNDACSSACLLSHAARV